MSAHQDGLLDRSRVLERELSSGARVRVKLEPTAPGRVRILEYHRKRAGGEQWQRQQDEEGHEHAFEQLRLPTTFEELWPAEAAS